MTDEPDDGMDWPLLARYLSGEAMPFERRQVEEWVRQDPARQEELAELRRVWQQAGALPAPTRVDAMWKAVEAETVRPAVEPSGRPLRTPRRRFRAPATRRIGLRHVMVALAASLLLGVVGVGTWRELTPATPGAVDAGTLSYRTGRGQTSRLRLDDGTRVLLGPDSRLSVGDFGAGSIRELTLVGEAVFDVEHDPARPFIVHGGNAVTEALGTEFGIRAYPGDANVHVFVLEGRVALRADDAPVHSGTILERGQLGTLDSVGRVAVEISADPAVRLGWADGRIVFTQTPLREVVVELERWYEVDLQIADSSIAEKRITVDVPAGALYDVLKAVAVPLNLRYDRNGNSVRLYEPTAIGS